MAQRHILELVDDLDGSAAAETVVFGLDGREYEIDLSADNAQALRQTLSAYESAGRRITRRNTTGRPGHRRPGSGPVDDSRIIREWAAQNGHQVNSRGRIPAHVREAYEAR
jgi:hypothetical protein